MIFHSLTFARSQGRCGKRRAKPEVFNTSRGILLMLMNDKIMIDHYYCINSTKTQQKFRKCWVSLSPEANSLLEYPPPPPPHTTGLDLCNMSTCFSGPRAGESVSRSKLSAGSSLTSFCFLFKQKRHQRLSSLKHKTKQMKLVGCIMSMGKEEAWLPKDLVWCQSMVTAV